MDLDLLRWGLDYNKNRKRWALALGVLGVSYGIYRVYHSSSVAIKRKRLLKMFGALVCVAGMMSDSAEVVGIVSKDLKEFLESDSDQIPNSLKQISKISRSDEFSESLAKITRALTLGILRGYRQDTAKSSGASNRKKSDFSDLVLDKLFSEAGSGFASVVIGSLARNLVMAYYSSMQLNVSSKLSSEADDLISESDSVPRWVNVIFEDRCKKLIGDCVQLIVSTALTVFLDKTMHINTYDELFSGMTNPKHETQVREMLASVCNGAVETLVRTSHQALMNETPDSSYPHSKFDHSSDRDSRVLIPRQFTFNESKSRNQKSGWMTMMSSTLAVPSNRKFVLDVTRSVTFETVRCFLEYLLQRISELLKRGGDVIQEKVVDRGVGVVKHVSRRSSAVFTVSLSLCFHILNSPWILVPNY